MKDANSTQIELTLTVEEVNLILEGVGLLPFVRVYALVAKLQEQARRQLAQAGEGRMEVVNAK